MRKIQRDLQKLYRWIEKNNIVVEEVSPDAFLLPGTLGMTMNAAMILYENQHRAVPIQSSWIKLRQGMYPEQRLAVLTHELGHAVQREDVPKRNTIGREQDAWDKGIKILKSLRIKPHRSLFKEQKLHIDTLKRWKLEE